MGRKSIDFQPYKRQVTAWFNNGLTIKEIIQEFEIKYQWKPAERTFKRTLQEWGLQKQKRVRENGTISEELKEEIQILFFQFNSTDQNICDKLQQKGFNISRRQLQETRLHMGLKRRTTTPEEKQEQINDIRAALEKEFSESGRLGELGRRYIHENVVDEQGKFFPRFVRMLLPFVSQILTYLREALFKIYQEFFPAAVHRRTFQARRKKGEFIVYGPNQVWSIDGHDKLSRWGIHMYGGIDGYSRYMTWYHVGWYGSTAISTLIQYLRVVRKLGYVPRVIRADRGKEVPLLSGAHWTLVRAAYNNEDGSPVEFGDCFYYGRSMDNTRIEQWWGQLQKSCLGLLQSLFERMEFHRLWVIHDLASEIALLAVYMPIVRKEVDIFVTRWNKHYIRPQRDRANSVRGRPWENYFTPNPDFVSQWGIVVDNELLTDIEALFEDDDIDQYLPEATFIWCEEFLTNVGLDRTKEDDHDWPYVEAYNQLRTAIQIELDNGNPQGFSLAPTPPAGGLAEVHDRLARIRGFPAQGELENAVRGGDIHREGPDEVLNFSNAAQDVDEGENSESDPEG
ncbi:hypothetical protein M434DRAFT_379329 [Hypoxylon sp. CO27-5]|nr:hypothetical protein M434DRAFT_379329 [Hypoxylon sp. CO27-5]